MTAAPPRPGKAAGWLGARGGVATVITTALGTAATIGMWQVLRRGRHRRAERARRVVASMP